MIAAARSMRKKLEETAQGEKRESASEAAA
jgi:hypothetical protein